MLYFLKDTVVVWLVVMLGCFFAACFSFFSGMAAGLSLNASGKRWSNIFWMMNRLFIIAGIAATVFFLVGLIVLRYG